LEALPGVTILMPTLNASRYLEGCLKSIRAQDYPQELIELLIVDAGSTDETLDICARYGADRVLPNPLTTTEAACAVGVRSASRELIAFIDSDNYLPQQDWLRRIVAPFADPEVFASDPIRWHYDRDDAPVNRYFSLAGINDPTALFVGNYAYWSGITGRWNGFDLEETSHDGYVVATLRPGRVPAVGSNGFTIRREVVQQLPFEDYYFDLDEISRLVDIGHVKLAKVDVSIGHYFVRDLSGLVRKTRRRIEDFLYFRNDRSYPWLSYRSGISRFALSTVLVVPLVVQAVRGFRRVPDRAWIYHVPACWVTLAVYVFGLVRSGIVRQPHSRKSWTH
jgi:glycosyltransferase involved in cell wall biosynthesis